MKLRLKQAISILLCAFVALSLIQAAGATEISAAPLNPNLNTSFGEVLTTPTETLWTDNESQRNDSDEWNNLTNTSPNTNVYNTAFNTAFTSNTLRVPSENYSSIQSAVDAAIAGDTIIVESDTYYENVAITTAITLRGIDTDDGFPVIDARGSGTTLSVTADNVTVEGFELTGSGEENTDAGLYVEADNTTLITLTAWENAGSGIAICYSVNSTLTRCTARSNGEKGIYITSGSASTLTGCQADGNDNGGIIIVDTSSAQLTNCSANENTYGMYLSYSTNCTLMNNSMDGNLYNFNIEGRDDNHYTHSIDTSNTVNGKPIYYLRGATGNPEGDFANAGTIFAVGCTGLDIHDLALSGNKFGIYFWNTTSSTITGVTTEKNEYGICLYTSSDIRIDTCEATSNTWDGIYLHDCSAIEADNCRATENGHLGIHLYKSEQCTLTGNTMDNNEYNFNVEGREDADYYHSIDISNTVNGKTLYYLLNATGNPDGDFADAGVIYAVNCTGLDIHDLTFSNECAGVFIQKCSGLDIHDMTLTDNIFGILISTSTDITLDTITATENYYAIYLAECSESTIQGCIGRNNGIGLSSRFSDSNLITDCTMLENENYGIQLYSDKNCTVRNCSASLNNYGFVIYNSEDCHISECTASNNAKSGLRTRFSKNCIFSLNSFVNNSATETYSHDILWNTHNSLSYLYGEKMWTKTSQMGNYWGTAYNGTDLNGDGIGDSPFTGDGFTDNYPLMEPVDAYTFVDNEDSDDGNDAGNGHVGAAGNLNAGDTVTMQFDGTAVTRITITASGHINTMVITVRPVQTGPEGLNGSVYQYLEADLIHITNNAIGEANFTFDVPTAWLTAQGLTPADVNLWRFHDGVWVSLPTEVVGEEGNHIVFHAISPGFSDFAIAGGKAVMKPVDTIPPVDSETEQIPVSTPLNAQANESTAETVVPSETQSEAATATPPQQSPTGLCTILAAFGTAALIFRRH